MSRKTRETNINLLLNLDGQGKAKIKTGIGFLDHLLELFSFHALIDLEISAKGDFTVDIHHTNEDIGLVLGDAIAKALQDKKGIRRFGFFSVPMEDVLGTAVIDICGRSYFSGIKFQNLATEPKENSGYTLTYANHFFESLSKKAGINLHLKIEGNNPDLHANLEPLFKAFGVALLQAVTVEPRRKGVPSTKGIID